MMGPQDEQILRHLQDITINYQFEPMSFDIVFHFSPNDFFEDTMLTKRYFLSCVPETDDPFSFDGVKIVKCTGCIIRWKVLRLFGCCGYVMGVMDGCKLSCSVDRRVRT